MAEAVVAFVLEQLGGFLIQSIIQEAKLLRGVRDQVDQAKVELQRMRCFLKDADTRSREGGDERIRNWVAEIREVAYDLEDAILSSLSSEEIPEEIPRGGRFKKLVKKLACLYCQGVELHPLGSKIKNISAKLSDLRTSLQTYGISKLDYTGMDGSSGSSERVRELRRAYSHVVDREIVGFDENIKDLVSCLTKEKASNCRVVSICGMGGLGKTTLARKVYQHSQILSHFDCVAWACISQQCQVVSIWKQLLSRVWPEKKNDIKDMDESDVCRKLYEIQETKKCLIILDDIWTTDMWNRLSPAFSKNAPNSKILLTTRNRDLALYIDINGIIHEPQCLDDNKSWELFEKVFAVSPTNLEDENKKKKIGKKMLKNCGGLPLAIIVLRGMLSRKHTVFEWEAMHKNVKSYINKGQVSELCNTSENGGVSWVLGLSYDELPYQFKPCFLYLANFPDDDEINVSELCQLWMAEGFVSSEDMGYEILHELVQRCMVLMGASSSIGERRIKTCRVHDLMRDLCLSKAEDENFLRIVNLGDSSEEENKVFLLNKVRRLALFLLNKTQDVNVVELPSIIKGDCLRSIICFELFQSWEILISLFNRFHMLRVVKIECYSLGLFLPSEIGNLSHLRFLSVRGSEVDPLPSSISNLKYLQTLDLRVVNVNTLFINVAKWRLDRVRHLYLPLVQNESYNMLQLENASNAKTLVGISISNPSLCHFSQLIKLTLCYNQHWEARDVTFNNLRSLKLAISIDLVGADISSIISRCPLLYKLKVEGMIKELPDANQFSSELVKLTLVGTSLGNDPMPTLEKLPKLSILVLTDSCSEVSRISRGGFPQLESLYRSESSNKEWHIEEGAFPSLRCLTLRSCEWLPEGLRYVGTLEKIVFEGEETSTVSKLREEEGCWYKVQHVPSIQFRTTILDKIRRHAQSIKAAFLFRPAGLSIN